MCKFCKDPAIEIVRATAVIVAGTSQTTSSDGQTHFYSSDELRSRINTVADALTDALIKTAGRIENRLAA